MQTAIAMPTSFPGWMIDGHQREQMAVFAATRMARGPERNRRVFSWAPSNVNVSARLTAAQMAAFYAWFEGDLKRGAVPFTTAILALGSGVQSAAVATFAQPYRTRPAGGGWWLVEAVLRIDDGIDQSTPSGPTGEPFNPSLTWFAAASWQGSYSLSGGDRALSFGGIDPWDVRGPMVMSPGGVGKRYVEIVLNDQSASSNYDFAWQFGLCADIYVPGDFLQIDGLTVQDNGYFESGSPTWNALSLPGSAVYGFAIDTATGKCWIGVDGTWLNSGNPETGANPFYTATPGSAQPYAGVEYWTTNGPATATIRLPEDAAHTPTGFTYWAS